MRWLSTCDQSGFGGFRTEPFPILRVISHYHFPTSAVGREVSPPQADRNAPRESDLSSADVHRCANLLHCLPGDHTGMFCPVTEDCLYLLRVLFEILPALPDWRKRLV